MEKNGINETDIAKYAFSNHGLLRKKGHTFKLSVRIGCAGIDENAKIFIVKPKLVCYNVIHIVETHFEPCNGGHIMAVSYKKLFKLLIDRNMRRKDLRERTGISYSTLGKLTNGDNVNMEVIEKLCLALNCRIEEIVEIIPDSDENLGVPTTREQGEDHGA